MKKAIFTLVFLMTGILSWAQVGIGNTDPKASLDITASNVASPSNTDGILIPRVDDFPSPVPTTAQDGMLIFITGNGTPTKGFYYWDQSLVNWVSFTGTNVEKIDDLNDGKTTTSSLYLGNNVGATDNGSDKKNVAIGYLSFQSVTSGTDNVAVGFQTLPNNTTGYGNTAIGMRSSQSNTSGYQNTAVGTYSLATNTTGHQNTANGVSALYLNTTGSQNVASGYESLRANTSGGGNTATGYRSLYANTSGNGNSSFGNSSLLNNTTGVANTGVGGGVLMSNTNGNYNTALGSGSLASNTTGDGNTANGFEALSSNTTSNYNTAIGYWSLRANTTGSGNTAIGYRSLLSNSTGVNNTATGYNSLATNTTGNHNTAYGVQSLGNSSTGSFNVAIGGSALVGNTTGGGNTAVGYSALSSNTDGGNNTAVGLNTLALNTAWNNTAIGFRSLSTNNTGNSNTAIGDSSLQNNSTGSSNAAMGRQSLLLNTTGVNNTAMGRSSLYSTTTGNSNSALGYQAGYGNVLGSNNLYVGFRSGYSNVGSQNVFLGSQSGYLNVGSGSVFIGERAGYNETGSNKLYVANSTTSNPLIYGEFDNGILRTNGEFQIGNPATSGFAFPLLDGTANQIMQTNGSGVVSFVDPTTVGTDDQNLTGATLTGTSLQIDIENGSSTTVDLVGLQDGDTQNTLDQAYDEGGAGAGRTITADNGAVSIEGTDGFQVTGTQGSGAALTLSGAGTRMFFNPNKAAFRAGYVNGTQWDDVNVGDYSIAMGRDTRAAGHSVALGREAVASGAQSVAMGRAVTASANNSVAIGSNITAPSYNEIVVGRFNTTYAQNSTTAWNTADRLFVVGNGANSGSRSNALTVYKDGKLNINDAYDMPLTDGTANQIMATNGTGQVSFVDPPVAGTDDQNLTGATLTGTSLQIDIENGNSTTVDLSSLTTNANALVRVTLTNTQTLTGNANTKIGFDSETYDLNSNYDITTKRFTATKSGYYKVNCTITTSSNNPAFEIMIYVNNNLRNIYYPNIPATGNFQSLSIHDVISLNANDYIEIYAYPGITSTGVESATSGGIILSYLIIEQIR